MPIMVRTDFPTLRIIICLLGFILSLYALYVELSKEQDPDFRAMCDISGSMSCSKVFTSKYGRGFGLLGPIVGEESLLNLPNSVYGVFFYWVQIGVAAVASYGASIFLLLMSVLSMTGSLYLAYILIFVLEDACLVCIATYIVNTALFVINLLRWNSERRERKYSEKKKSN